MKYYKVLDKKHRSCNGGCGKWKPKKWMLEIKEELEPCSVGYHLCRKKDLVGWLNAEIWIAEGRGKKIVCDDKVVFQQARVIKKLNNWNDKTARLFACDCAEHVLHIFENQYSGDKRPRNAIDMARKYANGKATKKKLAAAWDAAWVAAWDAARAARDAAWVAARAARDAAWVAAWVAARDAARDAAWDDARAARAAVWAAAWDDARAARDARAAAWDAAWDAARDARDARAAAWDAERKWQTKRLFMYLEGKIDA